MSPRAALRPCAQRNGRLMRRVAAPRRPKRRIVASCSARLPARASPTAVVPRTDALRPAQAPPAGSTKGALTVGTFQLRPDTPEWRARTDALRPALTSAQLPA